MDDSLALFGVDVARDGADRSTIYRRRGDRVRCLGEYRFTSDRGGLDALALQIAHLGELEYRSGASELHIRIDTTGGYGAGPADALRSTHGAPLRDVFGEDAVRIQDVTFNSVQEVRDPSAYYDTITELYATCGEVLGDLALEDPPAGLEEDLTGREWINAARNGQWVKRIEPKDNFKKRFGRSPDHGDGCVLAVAPPELFGLYSEVEHMVRQSDLERATLPGLAWDRRAVGLACCGVVGVTGADMDTRLYVVAREELPDGRCGDLAVEYLRGPGVTPWVALGRLLQARGISWCVISADDDMWAPALDFADRIRDLPVPSGSRQFRRTYLARARGNDARPAWRDKPNRPLALKGEDTGYTFVVDVHPAHGVRWSLSRWRDGITVTCPPGDLWREIPHTPKGQPEPLVRVEARAAGPVRDCCLGIAYQTQLLRTGIRRGNGTLALSQPLGSGWAVAGMLADMGMERMRGGT